MIRFNQDGLTNQTLSSQNPGVFFFQGRNFGEEVKLTHSGSGCGCTKIAAPETVSNNELFQVIITIDKPNQSGYFAETAFVKYGDETYKFAVSGFIRN
jgi:hypothetical protein